MTTSFRKAFREVVGIEGGYSDDPSDSGGETNWGITVATARDHGYTGSMRDMPLSVAESIYKKGYWDKMGLDGVSSLSEIVAHEMFDTGVNCGTNVSTKLLQRWLNGLNREQKDYLDLTVDGDVGPATLGALKAFLSLRGKEGETVLYTGLNCSQGDRYLGLVEMRNKDERFLYGWMKNRVVMKP